VGDFRMLVEVAVVEAPTGPAKAVALIAPAKAIAAKVVMHSLHD